VDVRQVNLWEYYLGCRARDRDVQNRLGPYKLEKGEVWEDELDNDGELDVTRDYSVRVLRVITRKWDCPMYGACLTLAARRDWDNFTCQGCRFNGQAKSTRDEEARQGA
jgi:hypothetical protein